MKKLLFLLVLPFNVFANNKLPAKSGSEWHTDNSLIFKARATEGQLPAKHARPNFIYILTDDLGYGDVQCFNREGRIPTPNINRLASDGMMFTDAHAASSVCTPSRYSVLTGRYPWRSRLQRGITMGYDSSLIRAGVFTVGDFLQQQGYYTAAIGKWHLGWDWAIKPGYDKIRTGWEVDYTRPIHDGPNAKGFDYFYGIPVTLDAPPYIFVHNDRTVGIPTVTKKFGTRSGVAEKDFEAVKGLPVLTQKAKEFLITRAHEAAPFFLYLPLPSPHTPIVPDSNFTGKSGATAYGDWVMQTDWSVGQILKTLDSLGMSENTIVFFTSDNGFAPYVLNQPGNDVEKLGHYPSYIFRGNKADIWDGGHRVPFIVRWPGKVKAGSVCSDLVSLTSLAATCADILKVKLPEYAAVDSYSILPDMLHKAKRPVPPAIVYHSITGNFAIQEGKWKLIFCPGSGGWTSPGNKAAYNKGLSLVQLYDLQVDIGERMNVEVQHSDVVDHLTKLMEQYIANGRSTPGKPAQNEAVVDLWKKRAYMK